jgi:phytoene/squalene synthetase
LGTTPFLFRRPLLLARDLCVDRTSPDLQRLAAEPDAERFVWQILPHAARTFASCIALLPTRATRAAAVGYLYCRCLDTYEDLVADPETRDRSLQAFAARLEASGASLAPGPDLHQPAALDARDESHVLLVARHGAVDEVFLGLPTDVRQLIVDLVQDMAAGMRWSSRVFAEEGGVLRGEDDVLRYCRHVLGGPVLFAVRLLRCVRTGDAGPADDLREDAMRVGEMIQLANVTRDIEKDLRRGVAYLPALRPLLGREVRGDAAAEGVVRTARGRLLELALARAPSYRRVVAGMRPPRFSLARASGLLMLLHTERYYRRCARRAGLAAWPGPSSGADLLVRSFGAFWSREWADLEMQRIERRLLVHAAP